MFVAANCKKIGKKSRLTCALKVFSGDVCTVIRHGRVSNLIGLLMQQPFAIYVSVNR